MDSESGNENREGENRTDELERLMALREKGERKKDSGEERQW